LIVDPRPGGIRTRPRSTFAAARCRAY